MCGSVSIGAYADAKGCPALWFPFWCEQASHPQPDSAAIGHSQAVDRVLARVGVSGPRHRCSR